MKSVPFNHGWTYAKGDPTWHYGRGTPPVEIPVTLPHDATIHEKRTPDAASGGSVEGLREELPPAVSSILL